MSLTIQDRHLIDRYLQGDISGIELDGFKSRLQQDDVFRSEVELQELIYHGIRRAHHEQQKEIILKSIDYRKPAIPFALKMIVTFLVVTGVGISLWFYVGTESANKDQAKSWFAFLKSKKKDTEEKLEVPKLKPEERQPDKTIPDTTSPVDSTPSASTDSVSGIPDEQKSQDTLQVAGDEENIIVKQDQLLVAASLIVEEKGDESGTDKSESLSGETVEKLNPAADLPEEEKPAANYLVEFWVSPINYRGYKMSKNKLILFGIEEPDAVKLYRFNKALYMVYLNEFYKLNNSFDFVSYQKLKESEVPLAIK